MSLLRVFHSTNLVSTPGFVFLPLLQPRPFTATLIVNYGLSGFIIRSEAITIITCSSIKGLIALSLEPEWGRQLGFKEVHSYPPDNHNPFTEMTIPEGTQLFNMGLRVAPLKRHKLYSEI